jgi:hypothetical protein
VRHQLVARELEEQAQLLAEIERERLLLLVEPAPHVVVREEFLDDLVPDLRHRLQ